MTTETPIHKKRNLGVVFLVLFLDLMGFSIIFPLFPEMLNYYLNGDRDTLGILAKLVAQLEGLTPHAFDDHKFFVTVLFGGILGSLYSILQFVFAPIWGRLSDVQGRKRVLTYTISCTGLSYLLWFFAGDFWLLILARIVGGVMSGNISVATAAVSDITSRENRSKGMALIGIAFGLGFLIGPAVGGLLSQVDLTAKYPSLNAWGINRFSLPAAVAFLLTAVNLIWLRTHFQETLDPAASERAQAGKVPVSSLFKIKDLPIKITCWVSFIFMLSFSGMEFTLSFLAVERFDYTPKAIGMMFVYIGLWLIVTQGVIVRRMAPKLGEKRMAAGGIVCGIIALSLLSLFEGKGAFYCALTFLSMGVGLCSPSLSALVSLYADEQHQGRYLGIFRSAGSLARAIGPCSAALVYFLAGSKIAYAVGAVVLILPLLLIMKLDQPVTTPAENRHN